MAVTLFLTSMSSCPWAHKLWEEKGKGEGAAVEFEVVTDSVGIQPLSLVWVRDVWVVRRYTCFTPVPPCVKCSARLTTGLVGTVNVTGTRTSIENGICHFSKEKTSIALQIHFPASALSLSPLRLHPTLDSAAAAAASMSATAMAAALHHRPRSRPPLEDEDLLSEILLRLPPQPSSLPRASAVCKRWRRLVSDRGFLRRYRRHHCRSPPLLGFFRDELPDLTYTPTMVAPDRIPAGRFSLHLYDSRARILSCRHGLLLVARSSGNRFLVWDPVTRDQHRLVAPPAFDIYAAQVDVAVLRAAGDAHHFQVVLVSYQQKQVVACIYSSETGVWSDLISTLVQRSVAGYVDMPAVLVGDSLHWLLSCVGASVILQVDLSRRSLALIQVPSMLAHGHFVDFMTVMRAEGGGLGLLCKKGFTAQLWKRNAGCDGVASWVPGRTIELDRLLSLNLEEKNHIQMIAYAEENNVAFLRTVSGIFMVQLESLQFSKLPEKNYAFYYPLESVYAAETSIAGGHGGADQDMLV
ncbi:uncharacterized protein LOC119315562 [Triticum dicoccoides]|uniref:uncharacterized protein LOC119315562 n=1 Tax=Triticum dicoccoides TaxID=85692 RepID=UPI001890F680|nr:uncharacterized protein LOC119315562 [Triticum dicoccoides]